MDPQQGPPQPDFLIGQTIGNYRVTEKLGEGGMGSVYLAEHPTIGKKVALKVLHSEFSNNQDVANRFFNEARAVNDIGHPNIVDIVDYGILQAGNGRDQLVYFIMEYLAGTTLSHLIRAEAPLPPERALQIGLQVADALAASHKCGIVHRDLKPDNIILLQRGRERDFVKLLDFGIAKLTGGSAAGSHRTRTGIVMGTPAYMSPEQCEGRDTVDLRTDIYALGIVMYEMLTGRVPFLGEGYGEILVQHLTQPPTPVSRFRMLPAHVEAVVMKALEKRADLRYPNMEEFIRAMSDPVGYVEAHGGVPEFAKVPLMPSGAPLPALRPPSFTPPPGSVSAPAYPTPVPSTLSTATTSQIGAAPTGSSSKVGFVIAGVAVVIAAVAAIVIVARGGNDKLAEIGSAGSAAGSAIAVTPQPPTPQPQPPTPQPQPPTPPPPAGSDTAVAAGSNAAGSAAPTIADTGSGSASASASGSAAVDADIEITVVSSPPSAHIFVDGADTGKTTPSPLTFPKLAGKQVTITARLKGYVAGSQKIDTGEAKEIHFDLKAVKPSATTPTPVPTTATPNGKNAGSNKPPANNNNSNKPPDPDDLMHP